MKEGEKDFSSPDMKHPPDSLQELFSLALNLPSHEDRSAFLRKACGADTELRNELEQLLRFNDRAGKFMAGAPKTDQPRQSQAKTGESNLEK